MSGDLGGRFEHLCLRDPAEVSPAWVTDADLLDLLIETQIVQDHTFLEAFGPS